MGWSKFYRDSKFYQNTVLYRALPGYTGLYRAILGYTGLYQAIVGKIINNDTEED